MTEEDNEEGEVGYAKPPRRTRFKPGVSGNPKGRPKGAKGLSTEFLEEANETVIVKIGDRTVRISKLRAAIKRLFQKALEGNIQAIRESIACHSAIEKASGRSGLHEEEPQRFTGGLPALIEAAKRRKAEKDRLKMENESSRTPPDNAEI